jgi:hypothetical protein
VPGASQPSSDRIDTLRADIFRALDGLEPGQRPPVNLFLSVVKVCNATGRNPGEELGTDYWERLPEEQRDHVCRILQLPAFVGRSDMPELDDPEAPARVSDSSVWRPFPVDQLPTSIANYVRQGARAFGVDTSFFALPLLAMLASCVGMTRVARIKPDWSEPCIIWAAVIASSGTLKSPTLSRALQPLRRAEERAFREHAEAMERHASAELEYERQLTRWKRERGTPDAPPPRPDRPRARRHIVSDVTVEALAPILHANPRGVLLVRDELAGLPADFDTYKATRGGDVTRYLSTWSAEPITVDRKGGGGTTVHVPRPAVSIMGGIQPTVLARILGNDLIENGFAARLLMAMPPATPPVWTEDAISDHAEARVGAIVEGLLRLEHRTDPDGNLVPVPVPFTPERAMFSASWMRFRADAQNEQDTPLGYALAKMPGYCARFALLLELVDAADRRVLADSIGCRSVEAAIALADWFANEAARVYEVLGETQGQRFRRRLVERIRERGGSVTVRDVTHGWRQFRDRPDAAEAELQGLVDDRLGRWKDSSGPGRPTKHFQLYPVPVTETPPERPSSRSHGGIGDGDTGDTAGTDVLRSGNRASGTRNHASHLDDMEEERIEREAIRNEGGGRAP